MVSYLNFCDWLIFPEFSSMIIKTIPCGCQLIFRNAETSSCRATHLSLINLVELKREVSSDLVTCQYDANISSRMDHSLII